MRAVMAGLTLVGCAAARPVDAPAAAEERLAEAGQVAPAFRLPLYNPEAAGMPSAALDQLVGPESDGKTRALVVSFMASFCAPCTKELPHLQAMFERHRGRGLRVLAVAIDTEPEGQRQVEALVAGARVTFPVLKDRFTIVARRWLGDHSPLPSLFVVRPDGVIRAVHRGYSEDGVALLSREVEAALAP